MKRIASTVLVLAVFAVLISATTTLVLTQLAATGNPIAKRLGLVSLKSEVLDVGQCPGSYASTIAWICGSEPSRGYVGWPIMNGLVMRTKVSSLDDVAGMPITFLKGHPQPLPTCIEKLAVLGTIVDKLAKGENVKTENRESLASLLDQAESLALITKQEMQKESPQYAQTFFHSLDLLAQNAASAAQKLRLKSA